MKLRVSFVPALSILLLAVAVTPTAKGLQSGYYTDANGNFVSAGQQNAPVPNTSTPAATNNQSQDNPTGYPPTNTAPMWGGLQQQSAQAQPQSGQARAQGGSVNQMRYVSWQDPAEGAFSVLLPEGWPVRGGTVRTSRIEAHYVVRAQSPSGGVQMFMDDPRLNLRQLPNAASQLLGWREGMQIPAPSQVGGTFLMLRYEPGADAAARYVREAVCPNASNFRGGVIPTQNAELNRAMQPIAQAEGKQMRADVGELAFECGAQHGYVYAITVLGWQPGGQIAAWAIYRIAGFLATPQEHGMAAAAIQKLIGSFQMNQAWLQRYAQECNDTAGNAINESNAITQSTMDYTRQIEQVAEANNRSWQQNQTERTNAINGANHAITNTSSYGSGATGHDYNWVLGTKTVCDNVDRCQTVDANTDNQTYYSGCSGNFVSGNRAGQAPPASLSACGWTQGH